MLYFLTYNIINIEIDSNRSPKETKNHLHSYKTQNLLSILKEYEKIQKVKKLYIKAEFQGYR